MLQTRTLITNLLSNFVMDKTNPNPFWRQLLCLADDLIADWKRNLTLLWFPISSLSYLCLIFFFFYFQTSAALFLDWLAFFAPCSLCLLFFCALALFTCSCPKNQKSHPHTNVFWLSSFLLHIPGVVIRPGAARAAAATHVGAAEGDTGILISVIAASRCDSSVDSYFN